MGLGVVVYMKFGTTIHWADFKIPANPAIRAEFVRGDLFWPGRAWSLRRSWAMKSKTLRRSFPGAVAWGGLLSGLLYIGATLTLLIAVDKNSISVLQGIVQAVSHMAGRSTCHGSLFRSHFC